MKPPFVARGDAMSGSTFWHGALMDQWANAWDAYFTGGQGNFMVSAMEDTGTMQALTFLGQAGRMDIHRVLLLRTVSNYDRPAPGEAPADSLKRMASGDYPAFRGRSKPRKWWAIKWCAISSSTGTSVPRKFRARL